eukprot:4779905-Alexandrium_andersonii.AAC.1
MESCGHSGRPEHPAAVAGTARWPGRGEGSIVCPCAGSQGSQQRRAPRGPPHPAVPTPVRRVGRGRRERA